MVDKYSGNERRESVRLDQIINVEFILIDESKETLSGKKYRGIIQNISAGGVRMEVPDLDDSLVAGLNSGMTKLGLEIKLPGVERNVKTLGKVLWLSRGISFDDEGNKKTIIGLEFVDITTADKDLIKDFIIRAYLKK